MQQISCVIDKQYIRIPLKCIKDIQKRETITKEIKEQLTISIKKDPQFTFYKNKNIIKKI